MELNEAFGQTLRSSRKAAGLTQEDFSSVSGRTYLSALERGLQSPTIDKVRSLSDVIGLHPLTLLVATFVLADKKDSNELLIMVQKELEQVGLAQIV